MTLDPNRIQMEDPRVRLAEERTLLAWIRTGLAMMGFGFVVARFGMFLREAAASGLAQEQLQQHPTHLSLWIGTAMVLLGVAVNLLAAMQHVRFLRRLNRGQPYLPPPWSLGALIAVILAALGIIMTAYLVVVGH